MAQWMVEFCCCCCFVVVEVVVVAWAVVVAMVVGHPDPEIHSELSYNEKKDHCSCRNRVPSWPPQGQQP